MNDYPLALYRAGSGFEWDGKPTDMLTVADEASHKSALAEGWAAAAEYLQPPKRRAQPRKDD